MPRKRIEVINPDTGDVQQGYVVWLADLPNRLEGYIVGFQEAFITLARDREMTLDHHRVLHYLFGKLDFNNYIRITQKEIGEVLGLDKSNVSKAMSLLRQKQIILTAPTKNGERFLKLNHFYGWKGSVTELKKQQPRLKLVKVQQEKS